MTKTKAKETNELSLESILWNCRVALRGIGGNEKNRDAVMGLVFLKFAGDKFETRREQIKLEHGDVEAFLNKPSFYLSHSVFYLPEHCRWQHIVQNASDSGLAVIIDKAMMDIVDKNPSLQGALPQSFYSGFGATQRDLKKLIDEINKIDQKRFVDNDLIGRVYEYFLQTFAVAATKEEGEFYTPASLVSLIAELIEPYEGVVYDPCCGTGGMFVQSHKFIERHHGNRLKVSIYGQEKSPETRRLAKLNLAIRGISHNLGKPTGEQQSSFQNDQHEDLKVDFIMANPPFNFKDWRGEDELTTDPRWRGYQVPPKSNANYAWILHMIDKLKVDNGIAGFLLANGALNADGIEGRIREQLIKNDKIEAIIVLPRDMFYTTDISVTLWIVNNNKKARELNGRKLKDRQNQVLFVDLRRWSDNLEAYKLDGGSTKKKVVLNEEQIAKVKDIYFNWQTGLGYTDVPELCKSATLDEIAKQNYSLSPSKYIEFVDRDLDIDYDKEMKRIQQEMKDILQQEKQSQQMLQDAFRGIGYGID
ncbi:MAG: type I restriction-modification system subunit M [Clostridiales bacterium]|nr:type I restriction-modification system subunit M [Clostridiales bacterium]